MDTLGTDEPLPPGQRPKSADIDSVMLAGCGTFLVVSVLVYGLTVWPYLQWPNSERLSLLIRCSAAGFIPALVVGVLGSRKGGMAGACGLVAGALTGSVFLFLRLQQLFTVTGTSVGHDPDYPGWVLYALPSGWFVLALITAIIATPQVKFRGLGAELPR